MKLQKSSAVVTLICTIFLFLPFFQPNLSASDFEGVIKISMKSDMFSFSADYFVKSDKLRIEMGGSGGMMQGMASGGEQAVTILDYKAKKIYTLMPSEKMYIEMPYMENQMKEDNMEFQKAMKDIKPQKTGKTEKINGYACELWTMTAEENGEKMVSEMWMSKDFPEIKGLMQKNQLLPKMSEQDGMPLRMIVRDNSGKEMMRWEVLDVKAKSLDDKLFKVPSDYIKQSFMMPPGDFQMPEGIEMPEDMQE